MASAYPEPVTAAQVGAYFVRQYYQVLRKQPDFVHQFYTDVSSMLRIDGAIEEKAMALMQIHELIMSFNFTGIEIKTAHSLDSWNGGVLVMISGSVQTGEYSIWRKFVQNFFLAPQENGYFVLNDIFQYIEEEQMHHHPEAMSGHDNFDSKLTVSNPDPEPDSGYTLGEATLPNDYVSPDHVEESETVEYSILEPQQQVSEADERVVEEEESSAEEPVVSFPSTINTVKDAPFAAIEEPVVEPPKKTYASILRITKGQSGQSSPQPYVGQSTQAASEWHHVPQHAPQQTPHVWSTGPEKSGSETLEEVAELEEEGQMRSVYVRNLPPSVSASDLETEFKNFGRIKHDGVLVKSRKEAGIYYAFVEFEDTSGVQNAVKASPILFGGRQIYVEERRPNTGASRGGRRGRGRGSGLQSETLRGRFSGARGFGRVSVQDNNERDYYNRPRGNGYHQLGGSRGILGSQFSRDNSQNPSDVGF